MRSALGKSARTGDEPVTGDVLAVNPPHELVHRWGDDVVRWRLAPTATGS